MNRPQTKPKPKQTIFWRIRQYILGAVGKKKQSNEQQHNKLAVQANRNKMELFKLTLNQPNIKTQNVALITHHNKLIVRAVNEASARESAVKAVNIYAATRKKKPKDTDRNPIAPWQDPALAICKPYKGPHYPKHGKSIIVYPPDLKIE